MRGPIREKSPYVCGEYGELCVTFLGCYDAYFEVLLGQLVVNVVNADLGSPGIAAQMSVHRRGS